MHGLTRLLYTVAMFFHILWYYIIPRFQDHHLTMTSYLAIPTSLSCDLHFLSRDLDKIILRFGLPIS